MVRNSKQGLQIEQETQLGKVIQVCLMSQCPHINAQPDLSSPSSLSNRDYVNALLLAQNRNAKCSTKQCILDTRVLIGDCGGDEMRCTYWPPAPMVLH